VDEKRSLSRAEIATSATLARLEQARLNVTISEATLRTNRERADASLTAARILEADRLQRATRLTTLHSGELVSREELDAAIAEAASATAARVGAEIRIAELLTDELAIGNQREQVRLAEADFESSQVALLDANQRMLETRIFAPIDGVVSALDVQEGQIISSAISNVGGGTTLLTISDLQRILVYASVDENDVGEVQIGQRVEIAAEGFEKETFHGSVERIAVKGSDLNNVISFETRIHVSGNNARKLKPEMSVSASIVLEEATGVVMIPSECLIPIGDGWEVDVRLPNGRIQSRPVMVGITDGVSTEIRSGLAKGDAVVLKGMIDSQWQAPKKRQRAFPPGPGPAGAL
jgi:HlyD family secretion protein